jgi:RNA polymerase sigma factor (sigma-70 family)
LRALKSYRETSPFKAWLYTIALNTSRSRLRKKKALLRLQQTLTALFRAQSQRTPTLEEAIIHNEDDAMLWKALEKLGEKHRLPIVLRYYHDLSIKEIAEILKVKEGTFIAAVDLSRKTVQSSMVCLGHRRENDEHHHKARALLQAAAGLLRPRQIGARCDPTDCRECGTYASVWLTGLKLRNPACEWDNLSRILIAGHQELFSSKTALE